MKIAYIDCFSGISGDMFLGALIDLGLPLEALKDALLTLSLEGYRLGTDREERHHLFGTRLLVHIDRERQEERDMGDIKRIILGSGLSKTVKDKSIEIFEAIAREEGKIHDRLPEEVHFHEVGATDSIIDIVGTVFGIEFLGIAALSVSELPLGSGFVKTAHGRIPIPAPATIALLRGIPVYDAGVKHELVTPTGAALVKGLAGSFGAMPPMKVERVGYGVGGRNLPDRPNLLRIILGQDQPDQHSETVVVLEANLDDTNPEWLGFLMDRLFGAGALDVAFLPAHMKKNRPGTLVQVIGMPRQRDELMDILFRESTTLGVRFRHSQRRVLARSWIDLDSPWGAIRVKEIRTPDGSSWLQPEYEVCRKIAEERAIPLKEVYYWVLSANRASVRETME